MPVGYGIFRQQITRFTSQIHHPLDQGPLTLAGWDLQKVPIRSAYQRQSNGLGYFEHRAFHILWKADLIFIFLQPIFFHSGKNPGFRAA